MIKEKLGFGIAFYRSALPEEHRVFRARSALFGARGRIIRASTAFVKGSFFLPGFPAFFPAGSALTKAVLLRINLSL
jgi:hypothetical protein